MENPIPLKVRRVLYVIGIVVGGFVAIVVPDILLALAVDQVWMGVTARASGALTLLLSTLAQSHLSNPIVKETETKTEIKVQDGATTHTETETQTVQELDPEV